MGTRANGLTRRALLVAAVVALLWAVALRITDGIIIKTAWGVISSRNALRPFVFSIAALAFYVVAWRRHWREDLGIFSDMPKWPVWVGAFSTLLALVLGIGWGTRMGAGPDPSGYVSQAAMFARGDLMVDPPEWAHTAPWDHSLFTASPVGWRPALRAPRLAPTYSPGLPLIMAAVERLFGPQAVFYVVPILGAAFVWGTYLLGSLLAGPWTGAIGAVLVVSSPTFLTMQLQVMSDLPVATFLTLSVVAAMNGRHPWVTGIFAGATVLTRPNVAPLVAVPFLLLVAAGPGRVKRIVAFVLPVAFACSVVAALNWWYYESPLTSGYGRLSQLYSTTYMRVNLRQYIGWFMELHTPLALIGVAAFVFAKADRLRVALVTLAIPVLVLALYVPFLAFQSHEWWYTRFLLPGYPGLFIGLGIIAAVLVTRSRSPRLAATVAAAVIVALCVHGWRFWIEAGYFRQRIGDDRYARAVNYADGLPPRSVLLANAHSGTLRFYTGRDVLRFEAIDRRDLDVAVRYLADRGHRLFLIGDEFEIDQFREIFAGTRAAAMMPTKPIADLRGVLVYEVLRP